MAKRLRYFTLKVDEAAASRVIEMLMDNDVLCRHWNTQLGVETWKLTTEFKFKEVKLLIKSIGEWKNCQFV